MQHTLWAALHGLVSQEARRLGVPQARADDALREVQRNAFTAGNNSGLNEALDPTELRKLTARVWSSNVAFEGRDHWPCSLLQAAIRDDDPVFFLESERMLGDKGEVPEEEYLIPFGKANVVREGTDCTLFSWGRPVNFAVEAAEELAKEGHGVR